MTNYEFIIKNLTDRDLACLFSGEWFYKQETTFTHKITEVFRNWQESIHTNQGNIYDISKSYSENPSVFSDAGIFYFKDGKGNWLYRSDKLKTGKHAMPRTNICSFEVWLSKQYDSKEWRS